MKNKKEIRMLCQEFKAIENEEGKLIIEGYAVVFNSPAVHGYTEIISDKALDNCDMTDVVLRYNHNDSFIVLARTRNHSLKLEKDSTGLKIRGELQKDITDHVNVYNAIKSQLIDKQSFAFTVRAYEYDYDTDTRTITDIDKLYDVSVVDQPFYDSTDITTSRNELGSDFMEKRKELRKQHEEQEKRKLELEEAKKELLEKLG